MAGIHKGFIYNSELIGAFSFTSNKFCFLPKAINNKVKELFSEALEVEVIEVSVSESNLIGILTASNEKGILLPWNATKKEIETFKSFFEEVEVLPTKFTALGNLITSNSKGCILHVDFSEEEIEIIKDVLKVKKIQKIPKNCKYLGSFLFANDNGFIVSALFDENCINLFKETFDVDGDVGTVNRGSNIIKLGLISNNKGAVIGGLSTGVEIAKVDQVFKFGKK